jgi:hypothetical protein
MSVGNRVKQTALQALVAVLDNGNLFPRIMAEIKRANTSMPNATGEDKRKKVLKDLDIIFDDLVVPVGKSVINLLLEIGVAYLTVTNPTAGIAANIVATSIEQNITS